MDELIHGTSGTRPPGEAILFHILRSWGAEVAAAFERRRQEVDPDGQWPVVFGSLDGELPTPPAECNNLTRGGTKDRRENG